MKDSIYAFSKKNSLPSSYIVISPLDKEGLSNNQSFLLGNWCLNLKDKNWRQDKIRCLKYHWEDREKFRRDYRYLNELKEKVLDNLSNHLNKIHKKTYPKNYWRIILGPWLINFISVIFDRWEIIRSIKHDFGDDFDCRILDDSQPIPKDFIEFRSLLDDDAWNYKIFSEILMSQFPNKEFNILYKKHIFEKNIFRKKFDPTKNIAKKFFYFFINFFEEIIKKIIFLIGYKKRFVFYESGFNRKFFSKIVLSLKTFPLFYINFRKKLNIKNYKNRSKFSINGLCSKNEFEEFLFEIIWNHLPYAYLEDYQYIEKKSLKELRAKTIITGYSYWYNELFKVWTSQQILRGAKFIILEHGGSFQLKMNTMDHLEDIADVNVSWGKELNSNYTRLPPNKLSIRRKIPFKKEDKITLFDFESVKYSYRAVGAPVGPLVLEDHIQKLSFLKLLSKNILDLLKVKPKYLGSWHLEHSYIQTFGKEIISRNNDLNSIIQNSRLIISGYPQTTFSEGMYSGVPTIMLFREDLWEIDSMYLDLITDLKIKKIIHTDPKHAADHLENIFQFEEEWWNSSEIIESRKFFNEICNTVSNNSTNEWVNFFRGF